MPCGPHSREVTGGRRRATAAIGSADEGSVCGDLELTADGVVDGIGVRTFGVGGELEPDGGADGSGCRSCRGRWGDFLVPSLHSR